MSSLPLAALILFIVFAGAIVQAGLGMGFGLAVAPLLALLDPALVPASALYLGMATALFGAIRERENIAWSQVGVGMLGRSSGILCGVVALIYMTDRSTFQLVFGLLIAFGVLLSAFGWQLKLTLGSLVSMGGISGLMGVITSVGAPPLAIIYQNEDPKTARPTLAAFFAFGGAISLTALYLTGWAGLREFWMACAMAPAAILGTLVGRGLKGRFDASYRPLLLVVAGIASVLLIMRGVS